MTYAVILQKKSVLFNKMMNDVANRSNSVLLLLRRTLQRSVILMGGGKTIVSLANYQIIKLSN
jgi:hypothetical protein